MSATIIRNHEKTPLVTNSTFKIPPIDVTLTNFTIQETQEDNDERSQNTPAPFSEAPCSTYGHNRKLSESASLKTKRAKQKLIIASTLCLFFLVAECVGKI